MKSYNKEIAYTPYFPLKIGSKEEDRVIQLQTALKRLGYYDTRIDGKFGRGTKRAIQAFQFDAELEPTGVVEKTTAGKLERLLSDENRWIIPMRDEVDAPQDQMALFVEVMTLLGIPLAFATAVAEQEGNMDHFDSDGFVKLRCEFWVQYGRGKSEGGSRKEEHPDFQIRYRSYGMLQILDMGNPDDSYTRGDEVGNITNREIKYSVAKNIEAGACLLKSQLRGERCQYPEGDECWYACKACINNFPTVKIDWTTTRWHRWKCNTVPDYQQIPCGWPEAIRRYNGSGAEAQAYRDEILTRIVGAKRIYAG
jgi:hypothetical protein